MPEALNFGVIGRRVPVGDWIELPAPAQVALNAIVEHPGGGLQFWALAFPPGKPEFHSEACRQLIIER